MYSTVYFFNFHKLAVGVASSGSYMAKCEFFYLMVFGGPEAPFLYLFSSAAPQRKFYHF
jgi:hypothetical protein